MLRRLRYSSFIFLALLSSFQRVQAQAAGSSILPSSPYGDWIGSASANGHSQRIRLVIDSSTSRSVGATLAPEAEPDSVHVGFIEIHRDSLTLQFRAGGAQVSYQLKITGNLLTGAIWVAGSNYGLLRLARVGSPEAAKPPTID